MPFPRRILPHILCPSSPLLACRPRPSAPPGIHGTHPRLSSKAGRSCLPLQQRFTDTREVSPDTREGFTDIRESFTDIREGFTDIRESFTDIREEFTDVREGFTDIRESFTDTREVPPAPRLGTFPQRKSIP
jgi:hypothetical protein